MVCYILLMNAPTYRITNASLQHRRLLEENREIFNKYFRLARMFHVYQQIVDAAEHKLIRSINGVKKNTFAQRRKRQRSME